MPQPKTVLVTGASSGIGLLTSVELARRGWRVLATMRDPARGGRLAAAAEAAGVSDRIESHALDVTDPGQIAALRELIDRRPVRLDALVNNAGFALAGFVENVTDGELRRQFDTNFFGAAAVTRALIPVFRRQGFGHILMVSSISGRMGFPGIGSYVASKFALEGWSEALRLELKPLGVHVVLVEPGSFETDIWTRNATVSEATQRLGADADTPEGARIARWRRSIEGRRPRADPGRVAALIGSILGHPRPRLRYSVGADARAGLLMRALVPWSVLEGLLIRAAGIGD